MSELALGVDVGGTKVAAEADEWGYKLEPYVVDF